MANLQLVHVGSGAAAATSIAFAAHQAGDIILIFPYKDGATSQPTVPTAGGTVPAWVTVDAPVGSNLNAGGGYRFVATASTTTSGTWTGATGIGYTIWRNQAASAIGGHAASGGAGTNTTVAPAVTQLDTGGTAALIHFIGHRTVAGWGAAPTGYTQRASVATETIVLTKDDTRSDGAVTQADTAVNGGYWGWSVELLAASLPPGLAPPALQAVKRASYYRRPSGIYVPDHFHEKVRIPV